MHILIGADPEVFVKKNGRFRSAHGLIPGTKKEPLKVDGGAVQVDGCALEYNINPAATEDEFVENNERVLEQLREMVPGYEIVITPTARFHGNHFRTLPEEAKELGCEPDFNAHEGGAENPKPDNRTTMRTGAGHIHIGFTEGVDPKDPEHIQRCCTLVKHLDAYLGVPSVLWDGDVKRRSMYGKAGAFRPKPYGVEYRTLSNAWVGNPDLMRYVYRQTIASVKALMKGERFNNDYDKFRRIVDNSDVWSASFRMEHTILKHLEKVPNAVQ